jgi:heme oxygenase
MSRLFINRLLHGFRRRTQLQRRWSPKPRDAEPTPRGTPKLGTLREAIRREQRGVDRTLSLLVLTERADYVAFLRAHFTALGSLANKWREADRADFEAMLDCLRVDLRALGADADDASPPPHRNLAMSLRTWGVGYVIRASRSACRLRSNQIAAGFARSYLDYSPQIPWPQFLADLELDVRSHAPHEVEQVIRGARTALSAFATAAADQVALRDTSLDKSL